MPDAVDTRAEWGVIIPSTNTVVEHDFSRVRPDGITFHSGRMYLETTDLSSDEAFEAVLHEIRSSLATAIRDVLTCEPDYLVMGMSAETFWGGKTGGEAFTRDVRELSGLEVSAGAAACGAAVEALGVRRIAVVTPYQPIGDEEVRNFFGELGVEVVGMHGLKCPTATAIAAVTEDELRPIAHQLDGPRCRGRSSRSGRTSRCWRWQTSSSGRFTSRPSRSMRLPCGTLCAQMTSPIASKATAFSCASTSWRPRDRIATGGV